MAKNKNIKRNKCGIKNGTKLSEYTWTFGTFYTYYNNIEYLVLKD